MLQPHVEALDRFRQLVWQFDVVFGHTPWMANQMTKFGANGEVFPAGWSPSAMGVPRWAAPKHTDLAYYGSMTGRRNLLVPYLASRFGDRYRDLTGSFGRSLIGSLEQSKASLYIAHSSVQSFSTWRTWQTICTSTAMILEGNNLDVWPMTSDHYLSLPELDVQNVDEAINQIRKWLSEVDLLGYAKKLHNDVGPSFTVDRCVEDYLIPASVRMLEARK
jgi:hypothetical protein